MRRPLPPELIVLGDQLETAAARALGRRRTRRQLVLNSFTSLVIAVPLVATLLGAVQPPAVLPDPVVPNARSFARGVDDFPPRNIRRVKAGPGADLMLAPSEIRRALR